MYYRSVFIRTHGCRTGLSNQKIKDFLGVVVYSSPLDNFLSNDFGLERTSLVSYDFYQRFE